MCGASGRSGVRELYFLLSFAGDIKIFEKNQVINKIKVIKIYLAGCNSSKLPF